MHTVNKLSYLLEIYQWVIWYLLEKAYWVLGRPTVRALDRLPVYQYPLCRRALPSGQAESCPPAPPTHTSSSGVCVVIQELNQDSCFLLPYFLITTIIAKQPLLPPLQHLIIYLKYGFEVQDGNIFNLMLFSSFQCN